MESSGVLVNSRALLAVALVWLCAAMAHAAPLLFHGHGHGLSYSADGTALLAPSDRGLAVYENGGWYQPSGDNRGFSGFSASERALYSSGHAHAGRAARGLIRSADGGATWQPLAFEGEADFPMLASGYRSGAIYVLNTRGNSAMPAAGVYLTQDEGRSWRPVEARGLVGEIHGLAAHPSDPRTVAAASASGLYLSSDAGRSFRRLDGRGAVTAVAFDLDGTRVRYARALSGELIESGLDGRNRRMLRLPKLEGDYVTCLAQNPKHEAALAFATRRRDVYVTRDAGANWQRISAQIVSDRETE
jgi:photosystem II stability/assembly factor-like uncharacterized protein